MPRCVTHTNLVLIPKKEMVSTYGDLRPISLSNFVDKIISRLIHERLVWCLPQIISLTSRVFLKEGVLLKMSY